MKQAKVKFALSVTCPYCQKVNGLCSLPGIEGLFIAGPPMVKACTFCKREFEVLTVRGEAK